MKPPFLWCNRPFPAEQPSLWGQRGRLMTARKLPERPAGAPPVAAGSPCSLQQPLPVAAQAQGQPGGEMSPAPPGLTSASRASQKEGDARLAGQDPGGRVEDGNPARPPGSRPRTWTIALPAGTKLLNANQRLHWAERGKRVKTIRHAAWALARKQQIPCLDKAEVLVDYRPPMAWRRGDAGNLSPSAKAALDGCTDAGVWADDCSRHVLSEKYVIGPKCAGGQLLIHITEVA